jgi:hypothetical protein
MIEAFILGIYMILMSPFLLKFGVESPITIFLVLFGLSTPGIYAMLRGAPFVPTVKARLNEMIDLAKIDSTTVIYDLGSGDGRFIFASCRKGAKKAIGYELSLPIYIYSKIKSFFYEPRIVTVHITISTYHGNTLPRRLICMVTWFVSWRSATARGFRLLLVVRP